jgi:iron-sulfur cluster protein
VTFPQQASRTLRDTQLRKNLGHATRTIRAKRLRVVEEVPDWAELRAAGAAIKDGMLASLPHQLERLEGSVTRAGGQVHFAHDGAEANRIVADIARSHGVDEVVKVKSIATDEIKLNESLAEHGIRAVETDLAELIVQLGDDAPSHIPVPAIHKNRAEIRDLFRRTLPGAPADLTDEPARLAEAARLHLRRRFLGAKMAISGANFGIAETGTICVVESEGNGRMCLTLPELLVTVMGIEKTLPEWRDLEVFLQLLPRSSTGERMNPYTSLWTGVREGDGPREFHLVLLDNGRTNVLADGLGRQALRCIRCSACLNSCPVYQRAGGHAYESVYPGPIGAILTPQLRGFDEAGSLPYASSLCGACGDVCPVKIEIPRILVHLRSKVVDSHRDELTAERVAMEGLARAFSTRRGYERLQKLGKVGQLPLVRKGRIHRLPGLLGGWTEMRDLRPLPKQTFREWWREQRGSGSNGAAPVAAKRPAAPAASNGAESGDGGATAGADPRATVMARIGAALAAAPPAPAEVPRDYRRRDEGPPEEILERFAERVAEYRATVTRAAPGELAAALAAACAQHGAARLGVPPDLPQEWRPEGVELVDDNGLTAAELDGLDGSITAAAVGIAETGSFVLDGGPAQGRRALTLVPDLHVCVIEAERVVGFVPEALERLAPAPREGRPVTFVSGPSATSDIELNRVEGVHGPRTLHVVIVS